MTRQKKRYLTLISLSLISLILLPWSSVHTNASDGPVSILKASWASAAVQVLSKGQAFKSALTGFQSVTLLLWVIPAAFMILSLIDLFGRKEAEGVKKANMAC